MSNRWELHRLYYLDTNMTIMYAINMADTINWYKCDGILIAMQ